MAGINSQKYQRNFIFKKAKTTKSKNINDSITIEPHVKLKGIWFSEAQNKIAIQMFTMTFVIGFILGIIIGILI